MSSSELNKDNKTAAIGLLDRLALDGENLAPTDKKSIDELKSVLGNDLFQALLDIQGYQSHTIQNSDLNGQVQNGHQMQNGGDYENGHEIQNEESQNGQVRNGQVQDGQVQNNQIQNNQIQNTGCFS